MCMNTRVCHKYTTDCQYSMLIDIIYVLFIMTIMEKLSTITSSVPLLKASEVNQGPVRLISA